MEIWRYMNMSTRENYRERSHQIIFEAFVIVYLNLNWSLKHIKIHKMPIVMCLQLSSIS